MTPPSLQVFDVQRKITYKNLANWYKELREFRPEIPCCVVANKIDGVSLYLTFCSTLMCKLDMIIDILVIPSIQRIWKWRREASTLGRRKDFRSTLCLRQMGPTWWRSEAASLLLSCSGSSACPVYELQSFHEYFLEYFLEVMSISRSSAGCSSLLCMRWSSADSRRLKLRHRCSERRSREHWTTSKTPATLWTKCCKSWRYRLFFSRPHQSDDFGAVLHVV